MRCADHVMLHSVCPPAADVDSRTCATLGHVLYSNRGQAMLTIVRDSVGVHDFMHAACSAAMFRRQDPTWQDGPTCSDNLDAAFETLGRTSGPIPTPFNAFMNVTVRSNGTLVVAPPRSQPGDSIDFRAEQDLIVAVAACSAPGCNGDGFRPIEVHLSPARD